MKYQAIKSGYNLVDAQQPVQLMEVELAQFGFPDLSCAGFGQLFGASFQWAGRARLLSISGVGALSLLSWLNTGVVRFRIHRVCHVRIYSTAIRDASILTVSTIANWKWDLGRINTLVRCVLNGSPKRNGRLFNSFAFGELAECIQTLDGSRRDLSCTARQVRCSV